MKCIKCIEEVPDHSRYCTFCGHDAGFPNVRAALRSEEVSALELRVEEAEKDATSRGCKSILEEFRKAISQSSAVISCSLGKINELLSSDNILFSTFYQAIGSEARLPENNDWDRIRQAVDSLLFPYYAENIRFGSLSIDGTGISSYGNYCIVLREMAIQDRATVFEENSAKFMKNQLIGGSIPYGHRSTWENRSMLGVAKLANRLTHLTSSTEFSKLIVNDTADPDFIEVHIYGPFNRRAIKHLSANKTVQKADRVLLRSVSRKLKEIRATMSIRI